MGRTLEPTCDHDASPPVDGGVYVDRVFGDRYRTTRLLATRQGTETLLATDLSDAQKVVLKVVSAKVLSAGNRELLRVIAEKAPESLDELAALTGRAKSNLSRTLKTMEGYGLVRLERGERGRIAPKITHDRVELDLPLMG